MKVWLDDLREMPIGFDIHLKTAQEAIEFLQSEKVTEISLDHDLGFEGDGETGYTVAKFIEEAAFNKTLPRLIWHLHTANPVGREAMKMALESAERFWSEEE